MLFVEKSRIPNVLDFRKFKKNTTFGDSDWFIDWFEKHDVPLRGHAVFWSVDKHVQDWVKGLSKVKKII